MSTRRRGWRSSRRWGGFVRIVILSECLQVRSQGYRIRGALTSVKEFFVYILCNKSRMLYTGVTSNLPARLWHHREKLVDGWAERYSVDRLVYFESTSDARVAIAREKEIKGWVRRKKVALINSVNPGWNDLSAGWDGPPLPDVLRSAQDDTRPTVVRDRRI